MFNLETDLTAIQLDLFDIARLFTNEYDETKNDISFIYGDDTANEISITINGEKFTDKKCSYYSQNQVLMRRYLVRHCKNALYKALEGHFKQQIIWGSLTGVRPTRLAYEYLDNGISRNDMVLGLQNEYFVSKEKANLVGSIVDSQNGYFVRESGSVNFYIHIPLCPSRCNYCSFVSTTIDKQKKLVDPYIDALCSEIITSSEIIKNNGKSVYSVYIGGGTPTCLSDSQFKKVLECVKQYVLPLGKKGLEFTCEAGRPETVTREKLQIMKDAFVTRVSVNPQSLNEKTLIEIGRNHSVQQFYDAFDLAKQYDFIINVDLIAGLGSETLDDFTFTLEEIRKLRPENITVHTLSRKRGSKIKEKNEALFCNDSSLMTSFANETLSGDGYLPYYIYRQKLMLENLENVGYCLEGTQCVNNITVMDEMLSVMACGAGAISKEIYYSQNRIERLANIKDIKLYLERYDEQIAKKQAFFSTDNK